MQVGIVVNCQKDKKLEASSSFASLLIKSGIGCLSTSKIKGCQLVESLRELCEKSDIVAVFGGDGTVLGVLTEAVRADKPVAAVNLGNVGFLSGAEAGGIQLAAQKICKNEFSVEEKTLLEINIDGEQFFAVNELVISNSSRCNTITLNVNIDGALMDRLKGDGVIVCTPTGSTAYALSAGGAILSPDIEAFQIVPLCTHSLHNRPVVYNNNSIVKIELENDGCMATADGRLLKENLDESCQITVAKFALKAKFLRFEEDGFFHRLFNKLIKWSSN